MYKTLRSGDRAKFGAGIKKHYAGLFAMYPDAHRQDDEALIAFVRGNTDYAEGTQRLAVRTFRVFAEFSDFDGAASVNAEVTAIWRNRTRSGRPFARVVDPARFRARRVSL